MFCDPLMSFLCPTYIINEKNINYFLRDSHNKKYQDVNLKSYSGKRDWMNKYHKETTDNFVELHILCPIDALFMSHLWLSGWPRHRENREFGC